MAYVTGSANSLSDLLTAIQNACTANGWTLSGSVLHKGTCYVEIVTAQVQLTFPATYSNALAVRSGTGIDGSNNLIGACDTPSGHFGGQLFSGIAFTFPATYFVHVMTAPDEVYVIVNHDLTRYQMAAFGDSAMPGLVGSGNWYCAPAQNISNSYGSIDTLGERQNSGSPWGFSLFCRNETTSLTCGVDHRLDTVTWAVEGSWRDWASPILRQPNQWNGESALIPIRVYALRPSGFVSPVLECAHARFVRIANLDDQQVITLGADKWKIYPWWQRSATSGSGIAGSGYFGHAIRYDGP